MFRPRHLGQRHFAARHFIGGFVIDAWEEIVRFTMYIRKSIGFNLER